MASVLSALAGIADHLPITLKCKVDADTALYGLKHFTANT